MQRAAADAERSADRRAQVGSGDRSERIRTYNFPQGRMTDHRINLTLYALDRVMAGDLAEIIDALTAHDQAARLARRSEAVDAQAQGTALLRAAGIAGASRDADRILAAVLEIEPGQLRITDDRALTDDQATQFNRGIAARALRQPVAQITGFRDFWAHRFKVTRDTLDPRPETEALVEAALARPWRRVLDLGTGRGRS